MLLQLSIYTKTMNNIFWSTPLTTELRLSLNFISCFQKRISHDFSSFSFLFTSFFLFRNLCERSCTSSPWYFYSKIQELFKKFRLKISSQTCSHQTRWWQAEEWLPELVAALLLGAYSFSSVGAQKCCSFDWEEPRFAHSFGPQPIRIHRPGGPLPLPLGSSSKQVPT